MLKRTIHSGDPGGHAKQVRGDCRVKNKRTVTLCLIACLGISCLLLLSSCWDSDLSRGEAKEVLEKYIGKCYGLAVPANVTFTSPQNTRFKLVRLARTLELVDTTQAEGASGPRASDNYDVVLTEKGSAHPHFEDTRKNIMFLVSENRIDEIIEIRKNGEKQFTVLFSYTQTYNDLGKEIALEMQQYDVSWIEDSSRLRGRATLAYDSYLKSYVIRGMMWSEWEKEKWKPALFASNAKMQTVFCYSYERREQPARAIQVSPPAARIFNRDRFREIEKKNAEKREAMMEERRIQAEKRNEAARQAREERQREIERQRTRMELKRLEREAETMRMYEERDRQIREYERQKAEKELNKKLLR